MPDQLTSQALLERTLLIDMHVHTSRYSDCGKSNPEEMVACAEQVGLQALVFTEHHIRWPQVELEVLQARFPRVLLMSGVEIETLEGEDLIIYGVQKEGVLYRKMPAAAAIRLAHEYGGFVTLAHPFRYADHVTTELEHEHVDGVEVMSIHVLNYGRAQAQGLCQKWQVLPMAASDAHHVSALGLYAIRTEQPVRNEFELLAALRLGAFELFSHTEWLLKSNAQVRASLGEARKAITDGLNDAQIANRFPGFTAHMVHSIRRDLDFYRPLE
ncbi:MAG: PHP-associated domain-containing protein [Anaerolineae bacterium]